MKEQFTNGIDDSIIERIIKGLTTIKNMTATQLNRYYYKQSRLRPKYLRQ